MSNNISIEIRYDIFGGDGIPHTFIVITLPNGSEREYGYGPAQSGSLRGPGAVFETGLHTKEGRHENNGRSSKYSITADQYNALMQSPTHHQACVHWQSIAASLQRRSPQPHSYTVGDEVR
ncbi:hypothetical protein [Xylella fastidiosa]|uniref:hypothetical protein n=1 Tax=Xylella fastidiosa TaxID=2371 RepID=UPI0009BC9C50|nr:hypothetical protein [Xylella fastidiosa]